MYSNDINDEDYDEGNESKDSIKMINRADNDYSDNNSDYNWFLSYSNFSENFIYATYSKNLHFYTNQNILKSNQES